MCPRKRESYARSIVRAGCSGTSHPGGRELPGSLGNVRGWGRQVPICLDSFGSTLRPQQKRSDQTNYREWVSESDSSGTNMGNSTMEDERLAPQAD